MRAIIAALFVVLIGLAPAQARHVNKHRHHAHHHHAVHKAKKLARLPAVRIVSHPAGCPRVAFCGCGVARSLGLRDRSLWLARNWLRFPRATPAPGMVAARSGHVFKILAVLKPGLVMAYDPNSGGHQTRIHVRRLAGFSVVNPNGRFAAAPRHRVRLAHHRLRGQDWHALGTDSWRNSFAKVF